MSEDGFHVHGAHEHAVEHHAHMPGLGQTVAIFTAILSTFGAILSYQGSLTKNEADRLEEQFRKANEASERMMAPHHRLAEAMTLIQIAISLASVTVLTRKKWLLGVAGAAALGGGGLWVVALF